MLEAGVASVTMIQRERTEIFNRTFSNEVADRIHMSLPIAVSRQIAMKTMHHKLSLEMERLDALERVGFHVIRDIDRIGIAFEKRGTHYLDVGASAKIAKGLIKIKSPVVPTRFTSTGLKFSDGPSLDADVIVFCTGFEANVRAVATKIFGSLVGEQLEDFWGLDAGGEPRGAFHPLSVPGIWYHGGDFGFNRYFSRFIALQIKADIAGVPFVPYTKMPEP
ncbi:hypothetical protein NA57DRAFT_51269 [Rhizodiscina lignyota]|uniref:Uncharacterized protein n=1 Tax=Rhizodiscina lignyota TaxID=1504668 RepID=A0A9P4IUC8_9PEZI|nr:hypothetical protein NA57DRAFT_51269 [Rhizodiscina lignyota]